MEIAKYAFDSSELRKISAATLTRLGNSTFTLFRDLGSPSEVELVGDAPDISAYFLPANCNSALADIMPPVSYSARIQEDGGLSAQACFPAALPDGVTAISRISYHRPYWARTGCHTQIRRAELAVARHRQKPVDASSAVTIVTKSLRHILRNGPPEHVRWRVTI